MKELLCNIKDGDRMVGVIKVKLYFDVPEEMLISLGKGLSSAFDKWQDKIVLHEKAGN